MTKGVAILIKIVGGIANSTLQCNRADINELSFSYLEMTKLKILEAIQRLSTITEDDNN
ncbi:MAG: hypothetical protein AABY22_01785 [Nanoarchaeota archaeon]